MNQPGSTRPGSEGGHYFHYFLLRINKLTGKMLKFSANLKTQRQGNSWNLVTINISNTFNIFAEILDIYIAMVEEVFPSHNWRNADRYIAYMSIYMRHILHI